MAAGTLGLAAELARGHLAGLHPRWIHVCTVAARVEVLCRDHDLPEDLAAAAWLHDVGYGEKIVATGFHPLDGARFLRRVGVGERVASLVAHHSGASFEAEERGFESELSAFALPPQQLLDILTFVDMTTSPTGSLVSLDDRLSEILSRYDRVDPVFRAVTRSGPVLRESAARAAARLGLTDVGGMPVL